MPHRSTNLPRRTVTRAAAVAGLAALFGAGAGRPPRPG